MENKPPKKLDKKAEALRKKQLDTATKFKDEVLKKYKTYVKCVVLFGSLVRGDFHSKSDIDLLVVIDIVERSLRIFDKIIFLVIENPRKEGTLFTTEERVDMINASLSDNVEVDTFDGLLVDYMKKKKINFVVRGLRALSDFDYEFQMAIVNKTLDPAMETIFIMTDRKHFYLNSSTVRELAKYGADISSMVPASVEKIIKKKFSK